MVDESIIYEKLNEVTSIRGFILSSVSIFEQSIETLINRVFLKTDFAVKSVVDSLLYQSGPLFELPIRLKLLFGLGVISYEVFEDINEFIRLKEQLNNDENEIGFNDQCILQFLYRLHHQKNNQIAFDDLNTENKDSLSYQVKRIRQEKLIRSYLILTISDIIEQLQIESPL